MSPYVLAFLIGAIAGLRSLAPPAAVSWAARLGWLPLGNTWLAFLGYAFTLYILTVMGLGELVADKLPQTPSRKSPGPFLFRIVSGALCGTALTGGQVGGLIAGALGGVAGTLGGYEFRARLTKAIGGKDLPIALLEDVIAIGGAIWIVA